MWQGLKADAAVWGAGHFYQVFVLKQSERITAALNIVLGLSTF
jgi:hypothetical protein